jgi:hypothetical protein
MPRNSRRDSARNSRSRSNGRNPNRNPRSRSSDRNLNRNSRSRSSGRNPNRNSRSRSSGRSPNRNSRSRSSGRSLNHHLRNHNNGRSPKLRSRLRPPRIRRRRATMAGTKGIASPAALQLQYRGYARVLPVLIRASRDAFEEDTHSAV